MICPNCRYHDEDTQTCARCGVALAEDETAQKTLPTPEQQIADHAEASALVAAAADVGRVEAPPAVETPPVIETPLAVAETPAQAEPLHLELLQASIA